MPTESAFIFAGLLLLVGIGAWAFGQFFDRDASLPTKISADYIRGLNLVLSQKTDEALELFIQMAKVDEDTLETHFALGHLFRRRGEFDRAIRVHENLLQRENLSDMQHDQALLALAEDYLGAGLLDRAEELLEQIRDSETHSQTALDRLVYIYEREGEWEKAIDTHRQLEMISGQKTPHVAHYYCELAEQALAAGKVDAAREYLKPTIRSPSGALRGTMIRAQIAQNEKRFAEAAVLYQQVLEKDPGFLSEVLPGLHACYVSQGRADAFEDFIEQLIGIDDSLNSDVAYAAIVYELNDSPLLLESIMRFISDNEVLSGLVDIDSIRSEQPDDRDLALRRVISALRTLALSQARFRCSNCGYGTQRFIWHCPSCKLWETIRPLQRFQLETTMN